MDKKMLVGFLGGLLLGPTAVLSQLAAEEKPGTAKGTYQNVETFDGGELKLSIASLWRPSGKNLVRLKSSKKDDEWGVVPDKSFLVKLTEKERDDLLDHLYQQQIIPRRDRPAKAKDEDKAAFKDRQLEKSFEYLRSLVRSATRPAQAK